MAYGLRILSSSGLTLFDTTELGEQTFVQAEGTVSAGSAIATKTGDMLLFKPATSISSGHAFWFQTTTTFSGSDISTTFRILRTAGFTQSNPQVDYVIVRRYTTGAQSTPGLDYGLETRQTVGSYNITNFDSRYYKDSIPEFDVTNTDSSPLQHGNLLTSLNTTTYYCANPLDYTNITNFIREYGLLFSNTTGTAFSAPFPNNLTGTGVRACNRLNQGIGGTSYPTSIQPYFWGVFR